MRILYIALISILTLTLIGAAIGIGVYFYLKNINYFTTNNKNIITTRRTTLFTGSVPVNTSCGVQKIQPSINGKTLNRIVNGKTAVANSWPWAVSLRQVSNGMVSTHMCGGSLFDSQYVITA